MKARLPEVVLVGMAAALVAGSVVPFTESPLEIGGAMLSTCLRGLYLLVTGWAWYALRVVPDLQVNRTSFVMALASMGLFVLGLQAFCGWIYAHQQVRSKVPKPRPAWRFRWSASIAGIVLLLFVAGISMVGMVHQATWLTFGRESIAADRRDGYPGPRRVSPSQ